MKLKEIAAELTTYLGLLEADPVVNAVKKFGHPFYNARAYRGGQFIRVVYVSYQGAISLTKKQALEYLEWLKAGNTGRHWKMLEQKEEEKSKGDE